MASGPGPILLPSAICHLPFVLRSLMNSNIVVREPRVGNRRIRRGHVTLDATAGRVDGATSPARALLLVGAGRGAVAGEALRLVVGGRRVRVVVRVVAGQTAHAAVALEVAAAPGQGRPL